MFCDNTTTFSASVEHPAYAFWRDHALDLGDLAPATPCLPDLASSNIATGIASRLFNLCIRVFFPGPVFPTYGVSVSWLCIRLVPFLVEDEKGAIAGCCVNVGLTLYDRSDRTWS
jgi:hypothetical protein